MNDQEAALRQRIALLEQRITALQDGLRSYADAEHWSVSPQSSYLDQWVGSDDGADLARQVLDNDRRLVWAADTAAPTVAVRPVYKRWRDLSASEARAAQQDHDLLPDLAHPQLYRVEGDVVTVVDPLDLLVALANTEDCCPHCGTDQHMLGSRRR